MDGGHVSLEAFEVVSERGATVYAPVPTPRNEATDRHAPKKGDRPAVAAWRVRMGTEEAKRIYRDRAATAERTNADLRRHRGLDLVNVRGAAKVTSVVPVAALTFNCLRAIGSPSLRRACGRPGPPPRPGAVRGVRKEALTPHGA